jgi:hypothetical protein
MTQAKLVQARQQMAHHPTSRRQDKAAIGFWQFDDLADDTLFRCGVEGTSASIILVDPNKPDRVVVDGLYGTRKPFHLAGFSKLASIT